MSIINVKCPICGNIFETRSEALKTKCYSCEQVFETQKGSKFYKSYLSVERNKLHNKNLENFAKIDSLIEKSNYYIKNEDYKSAEALSLEALTLTETNFRVYLNIIIAKTENFENLEDKTHIPYIEKAIEIASDSEKIKLKELYREYYAKQKLSKEEMLTYYKNEELEVYNLLEKLLKDGIPSHFQRQNSLKSLKIASILTVVLSIILLTVSVMFSLPILSLVSMALIIVFVAVFFIYYTNKKNFIYFDTALDIFDAYLSFEIAPNKSLKLLKVFCEFAVSYLNKVSDYNLKTQLDDIINLLLIENNDKIFKFFETHKYLKNFIEIEE